MTSEFRPETYGDRIAEIYDEMYGRADHEAAISLIAMLAGRGSALELGIGTGLAAIPLAERGVSVHGIDAWEKMIEKLKSKEMGRHINVTIGDFTDFDIAGSFKLIFVVGNTFFGLDSQDAQIQWLRAVARHLQPDGRFLLDCFGPDPNQLARGQDVSVSKIQPDHVQLDITKFDLSAQQLTFQHMMIDERGVRLYPGRLRWCWPSELAPRRTRRAFILTADLVRVNIQRRRRAEADAAWHKRYAIRAGIEGTNSEMKRGHGLGDLRVRGGPRVCLAVYLKALACNVKRMLRALQPTAPPDKDALQPANGLLMAVAA